MLAEVGSATESWLAPQLIGLGYLALLIIQLRYLKFRYDLRFPLTRVQAFFSISVAIVAALLGILMMVAFHNAAPLLMFVSGISLCLIALDPVVAVSTLIGQLLIRPWEATQLADNFILTPRLFVAGALFVWIFHSIARKSFELRWNHVCSLVALLLVWLFISSMASAQPMAGAAYLIERFLPVLVIVFMVTNCVRSEREVGLLRSTVVVAIVSVLAAALADTLLNPAFFELNGSDTAQRLHGFGLMGNANDLSSLAVIVIPFLIYGVVRSKSSLRLLLSFSLILVLTALAISQSRGGMLSVLVAAMMLFLCSVQSSRKYLIVGVPALIVPLLLFSVISRNQGELSASSSARLNYAIVGFKMAKASPLFGVGPGNYTEYYERYSGDFSEWGKRTAHSTWVLALAEGGIPTLVLFGALYTLALRSAFRIRQIRPEYLLALVSYAVAMSFLSHTYLFLPYLLAVLVVVGCRVANPEIRIIQSIKPRSIQAAVVSLLILICLLPGTGSADSELFGVAGSDKPLGSFKPALSSLIELSGSRGEILNFQLRARAIGCDTIRLAPFLRDGSISTPLKVRLFRMERIKTEHSSFTGAFIGEIFDPLIPVRFGRFCAPGERWLWGELEIPNDIAPGLYRSKLYFGQANVDIVLKVWRMRMPVEPALPAYTELSTWYNLLGHYGKWSEEEGMLAKLYLASLRKHRFETLTTYITRPEVLKSGDQLTLDIQNIPSKEQSFYQINIRNRPDWAYLGFPTVNPEDIQKAESVRYLRAIEGSIRDNSARKRHPANHSMVYLWDEPPKEELPRLIELASLVKRYAPSLKVMVTTPYRAELRSLVDIFVPVMDQFGGDFPDSDTYRNLQSEGKELWWYVSCMSHGCEALSDSGIPDMVLDRPSSSIRAIAWLSMRNHVNAFLYYFVNYAYQFYPERDPWTSVWDFSGNGDGTLFYPGRAGERGLKKHQPIPSIRLKVWREASFDAEYIRWIEQLKDKPEWWSVEFNKLVPSTRTWDRNYDHYQRLRLRVGEYLDGRGDLQ